MSERRGQQPGVYENDPCSVPRSGPVPGDRPSLGPYSAVFVDRASTGRGEPDKPVAHIPDRLGTGPQMGGLGKPLRLGKTFKGFKGLGRPDRLGTAGAYPHLGRLGKTATHPQTGSVSPDRLGLRRQPPTNGGRVPVFIGRASTDRGGRSPTASGGFSRSPTASSGRSRRPRTCRVTTHLSKAREA